MLNKIISYIHSGNERSKRAKKSIISTFAIKLISIAISLFLVPLTIKYVNSYQYGIWLTISSLVTWLSFFDIGLANGMKNRFIESHSAGDFKLAKIYVSTTYILLSCLIIFIWINSFVFTINADWSKIINASEITDNELMCVIMIVITYFCFRFILRIVNTLLNALQ